MLGEIYRVSFIGHRRVDDFYFVENQLDNIIGDLIRTKEYVEFYVGKNGEFDTMAASAIKRCQKRFGKENNSLILVLPYVMTVRYTVSEENGELGYAEYKLTDLNTWTRIK